MRSSLRTLVALVLVLVACGSRTSVSGVTCSPDEADCDGACAALSKDPTNCGSCGNVCPQGTVCFQGACDTSCGGGTTQCGQSCVESNVDPSNCGGCGQACAEGQACTNGTCGYECPPSQTLCGAACVSLDSDASNCGKCGHACSVSHGGASCLGGQCDVAFCSAGYGDCDANAANGCEADLSADPANCGRCGHDCCGGTCVNGRCQPVDFTSYPARSVALDVSNVYWSDATTNQIWTCPKATCGVPAQIALEPARATHLLADASNLYWAESQSIKSCSKAACSSTVVTLATGSWAPNALATDSTSVYWTTDGPAGSVLSCAVGGCVAPTVIASAQDYPVGVAVDPAAVYWSAGTDIYRCTKIGCTTPQPLVTGVYAGAIVVDGQQMYWAFLSGVARCDWSTCVSTLSYLGSGGNGRDLAVDGVNVFWEGVGSVVSCGKSGCGQQPKTLATVNFQPGGLVGDASCIYFFAGDGYVSPIMRVAKP